MLNLENKISRLEELVAALINADTLHQKKEILDNHPEVKTFFENFPWVKEYLKGISLDQEVVLKEFFALGQGQFAFSKNLDSSQETALHNFLEVLLEVESSYKAMGGVVGYHLAVVKLLREKAAPITDECIHYLHPEGVNIAQPNDEVRQAIRWGIESMPILGEIYPVGGAGDRLKLMDEATGEPLPAAELLFGGKTLLEGLIRDLQGREYLYYKLYGSQLVTPIALMTSHEKNNHEHIIAIFERNDWFGRPQESFNFFIQPLVPVITKEGNWSFSELLKLNLKPGGHGVMWRLASEKGVFDYFDKHYRKKAIVRQINNPVAGVDYGLLAFAGIGCEGDKAFGFASCPRRLKTPEGTNVLIETHSDHGWEYTLTNIEYTDFAQKRMKDIPVTEGSLYSAFPCNTNILFADLNIVRETTEHSPIPGLIINMKTKFPSLNDKGEQKSIEAGRLESTMQNIADFIQEVTPQQLKEGSRNKLKSFITFNTRRKTISVTKTGWVNGQDFNGTPEGCYYENLENSRELLTEYCQMKVPSLLSPEQFLKEGPSFVFLYHPALGPIYEVIGQKIRGGMMKSGAELQLEIAEIEMENVEVEGSLIVDANTIVGAGDQTGKCILKNVKIENRGIDRSRTTCFWKNDYPRLEAFTIQIEGNGEFYAENVVLTGNQTIMVPDGQRVYAVENEGTVEFRSEHLPKPTWRWAYAFDEHNKIKLKKK